MAIKNFIPEVWSASLLTQLRDKLVIAQPGVINRDYEGEISKYGDTVHIVNFADPTVRDYDRYGPISYDRLKDDERILHINQQKYTAFEVDDVDKRQAMPGFVDEATYGAAHQLQATADGYVAKLMIDGTDPGNKLPDRQIGSNENDAFQLITDLRGKLARTNTPDQGRFLIVPPEFTGLLMNDRRFTSLADSGSDATLRNGVIGRVAGFTIIESNTLPYTADAFSLLAGHSMATTYAEQILNTEAVRMIEYFGDGVRSLHVYGAKVIRPELLANVQVEIDGIKPPQPVAPRATPTVEGPATEVNAGPDDEKTARGRKPAK